MDNNLIGYVNNSRASGKTDGEIRQDLLQNGWQSTQVDQALQDVRTTASKPMSQVPISGSPIIGGETKKPPYPTGWVLVVSLLFGLAAGYFAIWQDLKRTDRDGVIKKFLLFGGLGIVLLQVLATLIFRNPLVTHLSNVVSGFVLPTWYYTKYGRTWETEHPGVAKFQWSLIGWSLLGIILIFIVSVVINVLALKFNLLG